VFLINFFNFVFDKKFASFHIFPLKNPELGALGFKNTKMVLMCQAAVL